MKLNIVLQAIFVFLVLQSSEVWSQSSINITATVNNGTKTFPANGRFGLGGTIEYSHHLFQNSNIRASVGYDNFAHNFHGLNYQILQDTLALLGFYGHTISLMPIRIGYEHCIINNALIVYAEGGVSYLFQHGKYYNNNNTGTLFSFAIGTGYRLAIQQLHVVQFSLLYNYNRLNKYRNLNYISFRVGYELPLGKMKAKDK